MKVLLLLCLYAATPVQSHPCDFKDPEKRFKCEMKLTDCTHCDPKHCIPIHDRNGDVAKGQCCDSNSEEAHTAPCDGFIEGKGCPDGNSKRFRRGECSL